MTWCKLLMVGLVTLGLTGCNQTARDLKLDAELARASLSKALVAWVGGKKPAELQPEITVADPAWDGGRKLKSFEIREGAEKSDGTNLHIPVLCRFEDAKGKVSTMETIYIVGTSPVVTIFPMAGE